MGKVKKYCPECGKRLEYDEIIKNHKVPNEFRKNIYHCNNCSDIKGKDVVIGISKKKIEADKFYSSIDVIIFESQ